MTGKGGATSVMHRYSTQFGAACRARELYLDAGSAHPIYRFANGFLRVEIDEKQGLATLENLGGKRFTVSADPNRVADAVRDELTRLFDRAFDGHAFLQRLRDYYLRDAARDGDAVPIRKIVRRLSKNLRAFRKDEFVIDLSRLLRHGPTTIRGRQLILIVSRTEPGSILLHDARVNGRIGYFTFS